MKGLPEERAIELAKYIVQNNATVRQAAYVFGVSKSTVHKDVSDRLKLLAPGLFEECHSVLQHNKALRHIRGGQATKEKYAHKAEDTSV